MDRAEMDTVVARLVANPHDEESLAYAHQEGAADPKGYATLLERVGQETTDPAYAAHWLAEAANVWSQTLGDMHRAARLLMAAIDKDPTSQMAADRLAQLYRDKGDSRALVALLDRRAKALAPLTGQSPELRNELAGMHEEMGRLWLEAPLSQPKKALDAFKKAVELDPSSQYAIFNAREILKSLEQWEDALPLYAAELALEQDPGRRVGLLRDEAQARKATRDLKGAAERLAEARRIDPDDPALRQEYAGLVLDRHQAGETVAALERTSATELLVGLAEQYDGDHGLAYAGAALDLEPGNDRAIQLLGYYARAVGREEGVVERQQAYLAASPNGSMAAELRANGVAAGGAPKASIAPRGAAPGDDASRAIDDALDALGRGDAAKPSPGVLGGGSVRPPPLGGGSVRPPAFNGGGSGGAGGGGGGGGFGARAASVPVAPPSEPSYELSAAPVRGQPLTREKLQGVLDAAQMLAGKGKKADAFLKYREVLDGDPAHAEALAWVEDYLRAKRDYAQLREVLAASVRATASMPEALETRKERLREIAGLCEGNLRDVEGAIQAWRQLLALDRVDESARNALTRLLERSQRWDELANLLEQVATVESDIETKVSLERRLAKLQEDKRKDPVGAADAWARIARLTPDDDHAVVTASRLYEKGDRIDLAAQVITEHVAELDDPVSKGELLKRLAELREQLGEAVAAGDSYAEAAEALKAPKLWEEAERLYVAAEAYAKAAHAAHQRGHLALDARQQAAHLFRGAEYRTRSGDAKSALEYLEEATDLDPINDDYAQALLQRYTSAGRSDALIAFLSRRGDRLVDRAKRVAVRREAASLCSADLSDKELARDLWLKVLEDGDDREALERLIDDAVDREDHTEAATLLRRLGANTGDKAERARIVLREASILAEGVGDVDTAIGRYELILAELDPTCRPALQAIAELEEGRANLADAADALERELKLVADVVERGQIASRLARMYDKLDDPRSAIRALDLVRKADMEDFDALVRLSELCEITEQWGRVAELLVERIEVEADDREIVTLTKKLASILAEKLDRGDEALGALTDLADQGDLSVRQAYIDLGDKLGWKGIVASKLKEWWFDARHGAERTQALRGAFERFAEVGRDAEAVLVGIELVRSKGADHDLATRLEDLAVKTSDADALGVAHDLLAREVTGEPRARELVRQAEVRVRAGLDREDAIQHGEAGLAGLAPAESEPLLDRLALLAPKPVDVVDLYERQVTRTKNPPDRVRALARAAQVAASRGQPDRARQFFELSLAGSPAPEVLGMLETAARDGDKSTGGDRLRRALCQAMAAGGHGARDGGRTRAALLRRTAELAHRELNDADQAFAWLADSLVAHVEPETLDEVEALGSSVGDPRRADAALSHALSEVFDGPLVRQLLGRRAKLRREVLKDLAAASTDLKKLHDLSPQDQAVLDDLAGLLTDLGDFRTLVQVYEDQILRGRDVGVRAELARKVARMWEEQLADAREAADAWRRVLRMKAGDPEATQGLERAKGSTLKKADPATARESYAPPRMPSIEPRPVAQRLERRASQKLEATQAAQTSEAPRHAGAALAAAEAAAAPPSVPPSGATDVASVAATSDTNLDVRNVLADALAGGVSDEAAEAPEPPRSRAPAAIAAPAATPAPARTAPLDEPAPPSLRGPASASGRKPTPPPLPPSVPPEAVAAPAPKAPSPAAAPVAKLLLGSAADDRSSLEDEIAGALDALELDVGPSPAPAKATAPSQPAPAPAKGKAKGKSVAPPARAGEAPLTFDDAATTDLERADLASVAPKADDSSPAVDLDLEDDDLDLVVDDDLIEDADDDDEPQATRGV